MAHEYLDDFPSGATVADQLGCHHRDVCQTPAACWTEGACQRRFGIDPKRMPRIVDPAAIRRKMTSANECRIDDCGDPASDGHHLVPRSRGGDDVEDNIIPLCHMHHMDLEFDAGPARRLARDEVGKALTFAEIEYVLHRLGVDAGSAFLEKDYGVVVGTARGGTSA